MTEATSRKMLAVSTRSSLAWKENAEILTGRIKTFSRIELFKSENETHQKVVLRPAGQVGVGG